MCIRDSPEGEYDRLCEILNGVFIQFKNDEPAMINPFDLEEEDGNVYLLDKILEMRSLISSMVEIAGSKLNAEELSKIDNSIKAEYETRGITHEADSLYEKQTGRGMIGRRKKAMPTLSDIHNRLKEEGSSERLVSIPVSYTHLDVYKRQPPYCSGNHVFGSKYFKQKGARHFLSLLRQ